MGQADSVLGQRQNVCSDTILLWFGSFCICEGLSGTCSGWVGWEWEVATCWEEQFLRNFCCWNMHVWNPRPVLFPASSSVLTKKIVSELPWLSFGKASLRNSVGTMNLVLQAFMHALLTKRAACFCLCAVWLQHPEQNAPYLQTVQIVTYILSVFWANCQVCMGGVRRCRKNQVSVLLWITLHLVYDFGQLEVSLVCVACVMGVQGLHGAGGVKAGMKPLPQLLPVPLSCHWHLTCYPVPLCLMAGPLVPVRHPDVLRKHWDSYGHT